MKSGNTPKTTFSENLHKDIQIIFRNARKIFAKDEDCQKTVEKMFSFKFLEKCFQQVFGKFLAASENFGRFLIDINCGIYQPCQA